MIDLSAVIRAAHDLDPLPASAVRLAELVEDPDTGVDQIAEVVAFDQALTLKMLRAANAAAAAGAVRTTNVREAVARLGAAQVVAFAVAAHARSLLARPVPGYGLSENQLWRHSVLAAIAAESLPRAGAVAVPPEAFTAALLHDVGKLVLNRFLTPEILELMRRAQVEGKLSPFEAEVEVIQVHHAEVGAVIAQHWSLPERIARAIQDHHDPGPDADALCDVVFLANAIAHRVEPLPTGRQAAEEREPAAVMERIGLRNGAWDELVASVRARFAEVSARYQTA